MLLYSKSGAASYTSDHASSKDTFIMPPQRISRQVFLSFSWKGLSQIFKSRVKHQAKLGRTATMCEIKVTAVNRLTAACVYEAASTIGSEK